MNNLQHPFRRWAQHRHRADGHQTGQTERPVRSDLGASAVIHPWQVGEGPAWCWLRNRRVTCTMLVCCRNTIITRLSLSCLHVLWSLSSHSVAFWSRDQLSTPASYRGVNYRLTYFWKLYFFYSLTMVNIRKVLFWNLRLQPCAIRCLTSILLAFYAMLLK